MRLLIPLTVCSVLSVINAASITTPQVIDKVSSLITQCWEECHPSLHPQLTEALDTLANILPKSAPQVESFEYGRMEELAKSRLIVALRVYYLTQSQLTTDLPAFASVIKARGYAKAVLSMDVKREVRQLMLAVCQEKYLPERIFLYAFKNNLRDEFKNIFNVMWTIGCYQLVHQRGPFYNAFADEWEHRMAVEWAGTIYLYSVYSPALTDLEDESEEKAEYRRVIVQVLVGIRDEETARHLLSIYSGGKLLKILDQDQKEHFLQTAGALEIYRQYGLI